MGQQARLDNSANRFLLSGDTLVKEAETILQDAGRLVDLLENTLMAQIAATKKWVPFTDETAVDGSAIVKGLYVGDDIPAADLVAGDVIDVPIIVGGDVATIDPALLTIENAKTLDTIVAVGTVNTHRVEDDLANIGIFAEATVAIDEFEN